MDKIQLTICTGPAFRFAALSRPCKRATIACHEYKGFDNLGRSALCLRRNQSPAWLPCWGQVYLLDRADQFGSADHCGIQSISKEGHQSRLEPRKRPDFLLSGSRWVKIKICLVTRLGSSTVSISAVYMFEAKERQIQGKSARDIQDQVFVQRGFF